MASLDLAHLEKLVKRFKGFNSPTDAQKLIILLGEKNFRDDDDNKKLAVLLKAEKKADQLIGARREARQLLDKIKADERKEETRKKIIWGSALKTAAQKDQYMAQVMTRLFNEGYISERDKDAVKTDLPTSNKQQMRLPTISNVGSP
jgi:predicted phage tail protein